MASEENVSRSRMAVVFTDVADSTFKIEKQEEKVVTLIRRDLTKIREIVAKFSGSIAKKTGDGVLALFPDVDKAVSFAEEFREYMRDNMSRLPPDEVLKHRIGIHWGEVLVAEEDAYGESVNLAARVTAAVPLGSIGISAVALNTLTAARKKPALSLGMLRLKGVSELTEVWEFPDPDRKHPIVRDYDARPGMSKDFGEGYELPKRKWGNIVAVIVAVGAIGYGVAYPDQVKGLVSDAQGRYDKLVAAPPPAKGSRPNQSKPSQVAEEKGDDTSRPKAKQEGPKPAASTGITREQVLAKRSEFFKDKDFGGFVQWLHSQPDDIEKQYADLAEGANGLQDLLEWLPIQVARIPSSDAVSLSLSIGGVRLYGDDSGAVQDQDGQVSAFSPNDLTLSDLRAIASALEGRSDVTAADKARLEDQIKTLQEVG